MDLRILANAFRLLRDAKHTIDGPGAYALVEVLAAMERELQPTPAPSTSATQAANKEAASASANFAA